MKSAKEPGVLMQTFPTPELLANRYHKASEPYRDRLYGEKGLILKGARAHVKNALQMNYNRNVTDADVDALFSKTDLDIGIRLRATDEIRRDTPNDPYGRATSGSFTGDLGRLTGFNYFIKHSIVPREETVEAFEAAIDAGKYKNVAEDYRLYKENLEHRPYELSSSSYGNDIREALRESSRQELLDMLNHQSRTAAPYRNLNSEQSAKLEKDLRKILEDGGPISIANEEWDSAVGDLLYGDYYEYGMYSESLPQALAASYHLSDDITMSGGMARSTGYLSMLDHLEVFGLDRTGVTQSDRNLIINALADLALENAHNKKILDRSVIDNAIGISDLVSINAKKTGKTTAVPSLRLRGYDLHDAAFRKSIGFTTPPAQKTSASTLGDALMMGEFRLFQMNNQSPPNGKVMGFTDFTNDGKWIMNLTKSADFGTAMHEVGHVFRRQLSEDQLTTAGEFAMGKQTFNTLDNKNIWSREAEEKFAYAFQRYLENGYAPNVRLKTVFESFKEWLVGLWRSIKGTPAEENLNPEMKRLFDDLLRPHTPSNSKIAANVPPQLHGSVRSYYGIRENTVRAAVSGNRADRLFQTTETIETDELVRPLVEPLSSLTDIDQVIAVNLQDPSRIAMMPGIKQFLSRFNPSAIANDPLQKSLIALNMLEEEGKQKAQIAFTRLGRLGSQEKIFGSLQGEEAVVGKAGSLDEGPLRGFFLNDIRSNPSDPRWSSKLNAKQREWIEVANELEEAKLAMFRAEGIDINTLDVEEGGYYAGRRVMGKVFTDGEIMDVAIIGGPSRPGTRTAQEKKRYFDTAEEAAAAGYRYLDEDETLNLNLTGAYRRAAQKRFIDYITNNVVYTRSTGAPDEVITNRALATRRLEAANTLLDKLQDAKRGGTMAAQTKKSIENILPEVEGMLDDVSRITLQQLVKAGEVAADQPTHLVPKKGMIKALFRRVQELENEIAILEESGQAVPSETVDALNTMKRKLGFQKYAIGQAYETYKETGTFEYTFSRAATSILVEDRIGAIDELLQLVRGKPYQHKVGNKTTTKYRGGLISDLRAEKLETDIAFNEAKDMLSSAKLTEGSLAGSIPAFTGKIFTTDQPTNLGMIRDSSGNMRKMRGSDVAEIVGQSIVNDKEFYDVLNTINTVNSASRFFMLAGDASLFGIQLLFLSGKALRHPTMLPRVMKGFINAAISPEYHQNLIHQNRELLNRNPGMLTSIQGTEFTEFARQMTRAGFVRAKPVRMARDVATAIPGGTLAGRGYMGFFKSSQRAFESAMDTAGIELLKIYDSKPEFADPAKRQEMNDFINEIRGLANPARLGVTTKQRQYETAALLAPRYNRAIAALITDLGRGGVRGNLARKNLAGGIAAVMAMSIGISIAQGEDVNEIAEHFNWHSDKFFTWTINGQQIGFGTKVRSLVKLAASIEATVGDDEEVDLFKLSMDNPIVRFARGNMAPVIGDTVSILNGRSYLGDPVWGDKPWDIGGHIKNMSTEVLLPKTMPIWAQSTVMEDGNVGQRATRGLVEFFGGRAYPEGSWQILNNYAKDKVGIDYSDLEPFERRMLREVLGSELDPILAERVYRGDKNAQYWLQLKVLDEERYQAEIMLLNGFYNPKANPEFLIGGANTLREQFSQIQNTYSLNRAALNKQFGMYQDDAEYDKDNPAGHVLTEWYNLFDKATNPNSGVFDPIRLNALQQAFWKRETPDGQSFADHYDYIIRNTSNTRHPDAYYNLLSRSTVQRWTRSESARKEFLNNRGNWASILDNSMLSR